MCDSGSNAKQVHVYAPNLLKWSIMKNGPTWLSILVQ